MTTKLHNVEVLNFLFTWCGTFPTVLTAIHPDNGQIVTAGFAPGGDGEIDDFVERFNGRSGLYFGVNADNRAARAISTKSRKSDIAHALAGHLDVDVYKNDDGNKAAALAMLNEPPEGVPGPPSLIINSGNGLQAFWRFKVPYPLKGAPHRVARVEGINRHLAQIFGGDRVSDINRIMRVPNTVNLPNKAKRAMGLQPINSAIVFFEDDRRYDVEDFDYDPVSSAPKLSARQLDIGAPEPVEQLDDLIVPEPIKLTIALGARPGVERASRSEWLFSAILSMIRCGERNETILGVITDARWAISASVLDKPDPDHHGRRQIQRAHAWLSRKIREDFTDD